MAEHPITHPSIELVSQWANQSPVQPSDESWAYELFLVDRAVRWGADQELEACCKWFLLEGWHPDHPNKLRAARRPKPPSLKQRGLNSLAQLEAQGLCPELVSEVRQCLEALPND